MRTAKKRRGASGGGSGRRREGWKSAIFIFVPIVDWDGPTRDAAEAKRKVLFLPIVITAHGGGEGRRLRFAESYVVPSCWTQLLPLK